MKQLVLCAVMVVWAGCSRSPHRGFTQIHAGLHVKLHTLGEGEALPVDSDSVHMRVRIARFKELPGSLFSTDAWYAMHDSAGGFIHMVFGRMHEGDSLSVIASSALVPWSQIAPPLTNPPASADTVTIELSLRRLLTPAASREATARRIAADPEGHERALLRPYTDTSQWQSWGGQLYYRITAVGSDTSAIRTGDLVTIHYTGRFVNERVFDDTHRNGQPLTFRLGDPGQVIKGLEVALHLLHPGGRGMFVIPSAMGFGASGSSSGIVPPHIPVVYDVEVVDVQRPGLVMSPG